MQLRPSDREVLAMARLAASGLSTRQVEKAFGCSSATVSYWIRSVQGGATDIKRSIARHGFKISVRTVRRDRGPFKDVVRLHRNAALQRKRRLEWKEAMSVLIF